MKEIFLLAVSLTPGILLLSYILYMDRKEPEPLGFVLFIAFMGAVACIPAAFIESVLKVVPFFKMPGVGGLLYSFLVVAPAEEFVKLMVVMLFVWNNKNFNEENDGIVYVGASSLGFAMFENVFYVLAHGIGIGIARALTSMPLHCFTAVIMGYFIGLARFKEEKKAAKNLIIKGFLIAYLVHGLYDGVIFFSPALGVIAVPVIVIILVISGIKYLKAGRILSLKRWDKPESLKEADITGIQKPIKYLPGEIEKDEEGREYLKPVSRVWKIVISRIFFVFSLMVWAILVFAYLDQFPLKSLEQSRKAFTLSDMIIAGAIFTFLPVLFGILLEISYYRRKYKKIYIN